MNRLRRHKQKRRATDRRWRRTLISQGLDPDTCVADFVDALTAVAHAGAVASRDLEHFRDVLARLTREAQQELETALREAARLPGALHLKDNGPHTRNRS